jgi:EAL domain-containing protein (putative c-di-GMP-specific phosphodiesterase class I)
MVVLRAVLALGKGLGIPVLTEGVETLNQLDMLKSEGCDQAQGYFLVRPCLVSALVAGGIVGRFPAT